MKLPDLKEDIIQKKILSKRRYQVPVGLQMADYRAAVAIIWIVI